MPAPHPQEICEGAVRVARSREDGISVRDDAYSAPCPREESVQALACSTPPIISSAPPGGQ